MAFRALAACTLFLATAASGARLPFNTDSVSAAIADLAQTAADGAIGQRHLQEASSTGDGMSMMAAISPQLQGLAGTSAASNAAGNTGASAAAAVTSAMSSLAASSGASVSSVSDVQLVLERLLLQFCSEAEFKAPENVPASWVGGGATIALIPHTCLIYPDTNTLKCSPAKLVLYRTEGSYNKAYVSAAEWEGKECKIQQQLGKGSVEVVGGAPYKVTVPAAPVFKSLWTPIYANGKLDLGEEKLHLIADSKAEDEAPAALGGAAAAASSSSSDKPDSKPSPKPDSKPSPKPDSKPTPKPDRKPSPKPDSKPTKKHDVEKHDKKHDDDKHDDKKDHKKKHHGKKHDDDKHGDKKDHKKKHHDKKHDDDKHGDKKDHKKKHHGKKHDDDKHDDKKDHKKYDGKKHKKPSNHDHSDDEDGSSASASASVGN